MRYYTTININHTPEICGDINIICSRYTLLSAVGACQESKLSCNKKIFGKLPMEKFVYTDRSLIERRYIKKIFTSNDGNCPFKLKVKNNMMGEIFEYYPGILEKDAFINRNIFFK